MIDRITLMSFDNRYSLLITLSLLVVLASPVAAQVNSVVDIPESEDTGITVQEDQLPTTDQDQEDQTTPLQQRRQSAETFRQRRLELNSQQVDRARRLQAIRDEKQQDVESLRLRQSQRLSERLRGLIDDTKLIRVDHIKQHIILVTTRYTKIVELLYNHIERVSAHLQERNDSGFDIGNAETTLADIEADLEATEAQIVELAGKVDELSDAQDETQIATILSDAKSLSMEIKQSLMTIRTDLVTLVRQIR